MSAPEKITITMSETAPVSIDPEQWPVIAEADRHDGAVAVQANTEWAIRVREYVDGRRLVYGYEEAGNGGKSAGYRPTYAGYLVEPSDRAMRQPPGDPSGPMRAAPDDQATIRAIRRVAGVIGDERLGAECIADLPAIEI